MRIVVKYGGTSISTPKHVHDVAAHIAAESRRSQVTAVCSAMGHTTDQLLSIPEMISAGDAAGAKKTAARIGAAHKSAALKVAAPKERKKLAKAVAEDAAELAGLVEGLSLIGEVTPRSLDYLVSFGERLSSKMLSHAVSDLGRRSVPLTGKEAGITTDSNFGESRPLMDTTCLRVSRAIGPLLEKKAIPIVGGFAGADQHGRITTFGRGGSDYTATIIASCIRADEVWLMSDVDGLMSADPKVAKGARVLPEVSYAEAVEMALFGAKQIHPRTFEPLLAKKIPMRIRNASKIGAPGTLVTASPDPAAKKTVKCVSMVPHNSLIDIRGGGMAGAPGTAAEIFGTLARAGVNVMMISQNPSESSISIMVKKSYLERAVHELEITLLGKAIKKLEVTPDVAIVALIGSGMRGTAGVASKAFGAVAKKGINVAMITQGSSELNLAFVVRDADAAGAVRALHDEFGMASKNES